MFKLFLLLVILSNSLVLSQNYVHGRDFWNPRKAYEPPITKGWCECGVGNLGKIHNGEMVDIRDFPMMAGLRKNRPNELVLCGATIISLAQVLTAAHCASYIHFRYNKRERRRYYDTHVVTGLNWNMEDKVRPDSTEQKWKIMNVINHQNYNSHTHANDIALITIERIKYFSSTLGPACLPIRQQNNDFTNENVYLLGYGSAVFGGASSKRLKKAVVPVVQSPEWDLLFTHGHGKDTCVGDSGGPVLLPTKTINYENRMFVVGVVSKGSNFCGGGSPAENARVSAYLDWIYEHTPRGITYCRK